MPKKKSASFDLVNEAVKGNKNRENIWYVINTIQANQLFVHSAYIEVNYQAEDLIQFDKLKKKYSNIKNKKITRRLPEILTLAILNALVPNSAMLLIGGHGGGKTSIVKYLGRMLTGISLSEAEECILRAHPQLTEEKIVATLDIGKLINKGEEKVIWRKFATSFWKIIDEVNRCSPYTQNILLSLLAEGKIKYYDSVMDVNKYCLYATLNPDDVGTFEMAPPFLDRFGISVPISMPKSQDLSIILESRDNKLGKYDELTEVPKVLTEQQLLNIWYEVSGVPCSKDAENFIHAIIREYTLCDRIEKGNSEYLKPSTGLCDGCHFYIPEKIPCSNTDSILSVRAAKDLLRYSRALTWLLGLKEVTINMVMTVAPYVLSHRLNYLERLINKNPYWGSKYEYTKAVIKNIFRRFNARKEAYEIIENIKEGRFETSYITTLKQMARGDLIVKKDLLPLAEELKDKQYQELVQKINEAYNSGDVDFLSEQRKKLLIDLDFPNRGQLIARINEYLKKLTLIVFNCNMRVWKNIINTIGADYPIFFPKLEETTKERGTYRLKTKDLDMEINITGTEDFDLVNFEFYGGKEAKRLKRRIEQAHGTELKSMDELLEEYEKFIQEQEKIHDGLWEQERVLKEKGENSKKSSIDEFEIDEEELLK